MGTPEEWLQFLDNLEKAINGQHITSGPEQYELTERLLMGDALATFKLKMLESSTNGSHLSHSCIPQTGMLHA